VPPTCTIWPGAPRKRGRDSTNECPQAVHHLTRSTRKQGQKWHESGPPYVPSDGGQQAIAGLRLAHTHCLAQRGRWGRGTDLAHQTGEEERAVEHGVHRLKLHRPTHRETLREVSQTAQQFWPSPLAPLPPSASSPHQQQQHHQHQHWHHHWHQHQYWQPPQLPLPLRTPLGPSVGALRKEPRCVHWFEVPSIGAQAEEGLPWTRP